MKIEINLKLKIENKLFAHLARLEVQKYLPKFPYWAEVRRENPVDYVRGNNSPPPSSPVTRICLPRGILSKNCLGAAVCTKFASILYHLNCCTFHSSLLFTEYRFAQREMSASINCNVCIHEM